MRSDSLRALPIAALTAASFAVLPVTAAAQTRFPSPGDHADYARYTLPQQCLAAVSRVTDSVHFRQRRDTLPWNPHEPLPSPAVATARRCITNFTLARVDTNSLRAFRDLALAAGDDSLAARTVAREFVNGARQPLEQRAGILLDAVESSLAARPVRLELARRFITQLDSFGPRASRERVTARSRLTQMLITEMRDMPAMLQLFKETAALVAQVPEDVRAADPEGWAQAENLVRLADIWIIELRDGPAAGLAQLKARGWDRGTLLGTRAPALESQYWFNRADQAPRPRPGKVSLLVYADAGCASRCQANYATLRRLTRAHPEVEVTIFSNTHGIFGRQLTTKAADEAERLRQYFLEFHRLPGALAVDSTPYTRIEAPDGRRRDGHTRNNANYGYEQLRLAHVGGFVDYYLVGPDGIIDFKSILTPESERQIEFEILAIQRSTTPTPASR